MGLFSKKGNSNSRSSDAPICSRCNEKAFVPYKGVDMCPAHYADAVEVEARIMIAEIEAKTKAEEKIIRERGW